jgi:hypothetical protein
MKKVYFFGTGYCAELYADKVELTLKTLGGFEVAGFLDNDLNKIGKTFGKYKIYSPEIIKSSSCDMVFIFLINDIHYNAVYKQLSALISPHLIYAYYYPLKLLLEKNYKNSDDLEILETLKYISKNKISVYNQFISENDVYDIVKWDRHIDLPYIDFLTMEGRRVPMYYPRDYKFTEREGNRYIAGIMWEQSPGSPHLYMKDNHNIKDGDCVIDAGVCEGNFALRYIDIASHIYLFEMDPVWQKPLRYTFRDYEHKVTIINRAVSDKTSARTCRIDDAVQNRKVDFIKMDVEGAELSALEGAEETFRSNDVRASICCYHRYRDEERIRRKLNEYGYRTDVSAGYMLFLDADDTWEKGDLRHGIVYVYK